VNVGPRAEWLGVFCLWIFQYFSKALIL